MMRSPHVTLPLLARPPGMSGLGLVLSGLGAGCSALARMGLIRTSQSLYHSSNKANNMNS